MKKTILPVIALTAMMTVTACGNETAPEITEAAAVQKPSETFSIETSSAAVPVPETTASDTSAEPEQEIIVPPAEDFKYSYDAVLEGVFIEGYTGEADMIRIPTELEGDPVVKLSLQYCKQIRYVEIPGGITNLDSGAFRSCDNLQEVVLPEGITEISIYAFTFCDSLETVVIPDTVETIGNSAFTHCKSLEEIVIPENVTKIDDSAFYSCSSLKSVTLPDGIESIGWRAFVGCESLRSLELPDNISSVDSQSFMNCNALTVTYKGNEYNYSNWDDLCSAVNG